MLNKITQDSEDLEISVNERINKAVPVTDCQKALKKSN